MVSCPLTRSLPVALIAVSQSLGHSYAVPVSQTGMTDVDVYNLPKAHGFPIEAADGISASYVPHENEDVRQSISAAVSDIWNSESTSDKVLQPRRVDRGIAHKDNTWVSLINATPYRWKRGYTHSYQLLGWDKKWPEYINSGQSIQVEARRDQNFVNWDSAGEVIYHLEGTSKPMSFQVEYHPGRIHDVWVRYREKLSTVQNGPDTQHKLGFHRSPGGVGFVLSGSEERFYSNDPPIGWMQSQLDVIGNLSLREVMLPRSHHAGMWKNTKSFGVGIPFNTQTHTTSLDHQLGNGGIRVLDFRPTKDGKQFYESHGSKIIGTWNGMLGASLDEMITTINKFNDENPGELIIWDIHPTNAWNARKRFRQLNAQEKMQLYDKMKQLKYRVNVPESEDITKWPLASFIGNKTSAVIIRVDETWLSEGTFPGGKEGFVSNHNFPLRHCWTNTNNPSRLLEHQVVNMRSFRNHRTNDVYISDWILTQKGLGVVLPLDSIMTLAAAAWRMMYHELWNTLTDDMYPNWLALDDIHGNEHKSFVMAVNYCLAARQCGSLRGKVRALTQD